jgi:signal transduction histidine kinase
VSKHQSKTTNVPDRRKNNPAFIGQERGKTITGLRHKFTLSTVLLVLLISIVFFAFFHQTGMVSLLNEFEKNQNIFTQHIAYQIAPSLETNSGEAIQTVFSQVLYVPNIVYIDFHGRDETIRYSDSKEHYTPIPTLLDEAPTEPKHRIRTFANKSRVHEFIVPVHGKPLLPTDTIAGSQETREVLGVLRVGIDRGIKHKAYPMRSLTVLWFLTLFVIFGVGFGWFLSMIIINPIQQLVRAMKFVASEAEDFDDETGMPQGRRFRRLSDANLNIHNRDEIGQLAGEFQTMMQKLENSYQRLETIINEKNDIVQEKSELAENLKELNRKNEIIIKDRTREVVEKNLRLYEIFEELQFQKEELISMNAQLEKISRMKSEFLASMSHELRTPMNSIIGFAEVLRDKMFGELNERQEKYLSNILASARHLLQLINNILDISKVEAGKMKLMVEPYSLNRVIDEVQNTIRTLAYKKNIHIALNLSRDIVMQGDSSKIKQILYNLLSNAIKFTDEKGNILISTEEITTGKYYEGGPGSDAFMVEAPSVLLTFKDNGIGIKEEEQNKIFAEFEQAEQTRKRKYEGTGLGLALTRKLVNLHDGHIWIESELDVGTSVFVILPIKKNESGEDNE